MTVIALPRCRLSRAARVLGVATALAIGLAGGPAWGHRFPAVHTVVVQVERCQVALLIGYAPPSGEATERILARVASQPKSQALDALRETLTAHAMSSIQVALDGLPVAPDSVRAKIGLGGEAGRPSVVVLATFSVARGRQLAIASSEPRTTRISWQDRSSGRIDAARAPGQGRWFSSVASFLLPLGAATGDARCPSPGST